MICMLNHWKGLLGKILSGKPWLFHPCFGKLIYNVRGVSWIFQQAMFDGCPINVGKAAQVWWLAAWLSFSQKCQLGIWKHAYFTSLSHNLYFEGSLKMLIVRIKTRKKQQNPSPGIWWFPKIGVPPNHHIFMGFSTINNPFSGTSMTTVVAQSVLLSCKYDWPIGFLALGQDGLHYSCNDWLPEEEMFLATDLRGWRLMAGFALVNVYTTRENHHDQLVNQL